MQEHTTDNYGLNRIIWFCVLAVFSASTWMLFSAGYWGHLHSAEGNQMFLYTSMYASQMLSSPGGVSNYIASFITQFNYWHWLGGALDSLLLTALAFVISTFRRNRSICPLALVPSLIYVVLLMDSNWNIAGLVALLLSVALLRITILLPKVWQRAVFIILLLPFLYYYILCAKFYIYLIAPQRIWWLLVAITLAIVVLCRYLNLQGRMWNLISIILYIALLLSGAYFIKNKYNALNEEICRYEYMVRNEDWDGIIKYSTGRELKSPLSTNALNLALAMKGELGDRMFQYYQNGTRSLINFEDRKMSSEILFHLGFVNEAAHIAFEDMASNPSREKGIYHITRLAKCAAVDSVNSNLLNRYIAVLDKTLFYRNFNPESTVSHDMEPNEDFFFNYGDFQSMLLKMHSLRKGNRIAEEYLAASLLLTKNLALFEELFSGSTTPDLYHAQAFQMINALKGGRPEGQLLNYINTYNSVRGNAAYMKSWEKTYWYYYNFR